MKVNAPPYLFSCDLHGEIRDGECVATIDDRGVRFRCAKASPGTTWGKLRREPSEACTKQEIAERRVASVEKAHARIVAERLAARDAKKKAEKAYLEKQWAIENDRRATIEKRQDEELERERERVLRWQEEGDAIAARGGNTAAVDGESEDEDVAYDSDDDAATRARKEANTRVAREKEFAAKILTPDAVAAATGDAAVDGNAIPEATLDKMLEDSSDDEQTAEEAARERAAKEEKRRKERAERAVDAMLAAPTRELPPPRASTRVGVEFTKLEQEHMPARASREKEIKEWKASQRENGAKGLDGKGGKDARDITEREPIFLKDKGDAFWKAGNYRAALEAYTNAIDTEKTAPHPDGTLVRLYANRAACHQKADDARACVKDCDAALYILSSEETSEDVGTLWSPRACAAQRLKLLVRRGKAHARVGNFNAAEDDLMIALKLAPPEVRAGIETDLADARACASPLDATGLRARGDGRYRSGDAMGAEEAYTAVIALGDELCDPAIERVVAHANRAAARLSRGDHGAAHDDCEDGLERLLRLAGARDGDGDGDAREVAARLARDGDARAAAGGWDDARVALLAKLLHRRGAARARLASYDAAADDYEAAAGLMPPAAAAKLAADVDTMRAEARKKAERDVERATRGESETAGTLGGSEDARTDAEAAEDAAAAAAAAAAATEAAARAPLASTGTSRSRTTWTIVKNGRMGKLKGGKAVTKGSEVVVHAVGTLTAAGVVFWNTRADPRRPEPFAYVAGVGEVVRGWDEGCVGMRVGETRRLSIPASEGYGAAGFAEWNIPPNADLTFDVTVLSIA